jgi:hypothetical protein
VLALRKGRLLKKCDSDEPQSPTSDTGSSPRVPGAAKRFLHAKAHAAKQPNGSSGDLKPRLLLLDDDSLIFKEKDGKDKDFMRAKLKLQSQSVDGVAQFKDSLLGIRTPAIVGRLPILSSLHQLAAAGVAGDGHRPKPTSPVEVQEVWTCGQNSYGELGHGDTTPRHSFVRVNSLRGSAKPLFVAAGPPPLAVRLRV